MTRPSARTHSEEAAAWVARMDAGDWGHADEAELENWLAADALRHGALLQAQAAWITLDKSVAAREDASRAGKSLSQRLILRRAVLVGGAVAVAASIATGLLWNNAATQYETVVGEVRRVPLPDGSLTAINTDSLIAVQMEPKQRRVRLDRGEAWFEVTKSIDRPFVVEAGPVRVRAVGTAFAVRRENHGAEVLVTEGKVEAWVEGAEGRRVLLGAGQRAFLSYNSDIARGPLGQASVDQKLAWRSGMLDLAGETLSDAIAEMNRYNRRQIVLTDQALAREEFDGIFRTDDPEGFANAVRVSLGVPIDLSRPEEIRVGTPGL